MLTRRTALAGVLLLLLSAFAPASVAAQHGDAGSGDDGADQANGDQSQADGGPPEDAKERREQARQRAAEAGLFGTFTYENGQADGRFVSFGLDEGSALVRDYTLTRNGTNLTVFDAIELNTFHKKSPARVAGSTIQLNGEEVRFQGFDNPTGLLKYQAQRNVTVTAGLTPDFTANESTDSDRIVDIEGPGNFSGTLLVAGNGTATVGDGNVTLDLQRAGVVLFRADPANATEEEKDLNRGLDRAASEDKLGASARIAGVNGTAAQQNNNLTVNASAEEATDGRVRVEVGGDAPEGKVVHLSVARDNLNFSTPDDAVVKFDGERVPVTDTVDEIVNASADDEAKAHVVVTNETAEIAVWVPDFSLHTITTKDATQSLPDYPTKPSAPNPTGAAGSLAAQARSQAQDRAQQYASIPEEARQNAADRASSAGLFGEATLEAGSVAGSFVNADVDGTNGAVTDVTVDRGDSQVTVLNEVSVDPFTASGETTAAGPVVSVPGQEAVLSVRDTPSASTQVKVGDQSVLVNVTLPSQADVSKVESGHLKVEVDGVHTHLLVTNGNGELIVNGDVVTANLGPNAGFLGTVHPPDDAPDARNLHERIEALKDGTLGAEASLAAAGEDAVASDTGVSVDVAAESAGDVSVTATVSSSVPDARAVTISVPKEDLDVESASEVSVQIDGQEIDEAASVDQVLSTMASGDAYAATDAGDAVQVAVQVSGFSDHTVTTSGSDGGTTDGTSDAPLGGALALVAAAGGALALSGLKRRR